MNFEQNELNSNFWQGAKKVKKCLQKITRNQNIDKIFMRQYKYPPPQPSHMDLDFCNITKLYVLEL